MNFVPLKLSFTIDEGLTFKEKVKVRSDIVNNQARYKMIERFVRSLKPNEKVENAETCLHLKIANTIKQN